MFGNRHRLALAAVLLALLMGCAPGGRRPFDLRVTLGASTASDIVRALGPPVERSSPAPDMAAEYLHFNVPRGVFLRLRIVDPSGGETRREIGGKYQAVFRFRDGLLVGVN